MKMWVRIRNIRDGSYQEVQAESVTWRFKQIIIKTENSEVVLDTEFYEITLYAPS